MRADECLDAEIAQDAPAHVQRLAIAGAQGRAPAHPTPGSAHASWAASRRAWPIAVCQRMARQSELIGGGRDQGRHPLALAPERSPRSARTSARGSHHAHARTRQPPPEPRLMDVARAAARPRLFDLQRGVLADQAEGESRCRPRARWLWWSRAASPRRAAAWRRDRGARRLEFDDLGRPAGEADAGVRIELDLGAVVIAHLRTSGRSAAHGIAVIERDTIGSSGGAVLFAPSTTVPCSPRRMARRSGSGDACTATAGGVASTGAGAPSRCGSRVRSHTKSARPAAAAASATPKREGRLRASRAAQRAPSGRWPLELLVDGAHQARLSARGAAGDHRRDAVDQLAAVPRAPAHPAERRIRLASALRPRTRARMRRRSPTARLEHAQLGWSQVAIAPASTTSTSSGVMPSGVMRLPRGNAGASGGYGAGRR